MWLITCRLASAHAGLSVRVWDARVSMWMRACLQTPSLPKRASMAGWCIRWHVNYSAFKRGLSWVEVSRGLMAVRWSGEAACREKVQRWGAHVEIYMCIPPDHTDGWVLAQVSGEVIIMRRQMWKTATLSLPAMLCLLEIELSGGSFRNVCNTACAGTYDM